MALIFQFNTDHFTQKHTKQVAVTYTLKHVPNREATKKKSFENKQSKRKNSMIYSKIIEKNQTGEGRIALSISFSDANAKLDKKHTRRAPSPTAAEQAKV